MATIWENLDVDYKIFLKNYCMPEEFVAFTATERIQLRKEFLAELRHQTNEPPKNDTIDIDIGNNNNADADADADADAEDDGPREIKNSDRNNNETVNDASNNAGTLIDLCDSDSDCEEDTATVTEALSSITATTSGVGEDRKMAATAIGLVSTQNTHEEQTQALDDSDSNMKPGSWYWLVDSKGKYDTRTAPPGTRKRKRNRNRNRRNNVKVDVESRHRASRKEAIAEWDECESDDEGSLLDSDNKDNADYVVSACDVDVDVDADVDVDVDGTNEINAEDDSQQKQPTIPVLISSSPLSSSEVKRESVRPRQSHRQASRKAAIVDYAEIESDDENFLLDIDNKDNEEYAVTTCDSDADADNESSAEDDDPQQQNQHMIPVVTSSSPLLSPEVKRELTEHNMKAAKKQAYDIYADRVLLHRFDGVARMGGGTQCTYQMPSKGSKKVWNNEKLQRGYPLPKMALATKKAIDDDDAVQAGGGKVTSLHRIGTDVYDMEAFTCLAYNTLWQVNGPKFAGQPTAAVSCVPPYMVKKGLTFPVFMKRSLTKKNSKNETKPLGWEYVGNYRCISDRDLVIWESAANFPEASKREIAEKTLQSARSKNDDTYGSVELRKWKEKIQTELTKDENDAKSLSTRARKLGFKSDMSDTDLSYLLVELDEFHEQQIIEFVEYDERIYEYCRKGPTTKNSKGNMQAKDGGNIATAKDWYNFANQHMMM